MSMSKKTSIIAAALISIAAVSSSAQAGKPALLFPPAGLHDGYTDHHESRGGDQDRRGGDHGRRGGDHDRWGSFWLEPFTYGYDAWPAVSWQGNPCRSLAVRAETHGLNYWQEHRVLANHGCSDAFIGSFNG